jgi:hypothetical protein
MIAGMWPGISVMVLAGKLWTNGADSKPTARRCSPDFLLAMCVLGTMLVAVFGLALLGMLTNPNYGIAGKVKRVDVGAANFTITLKDGKDRTFTVDAKTEFWSHRTWTGPKGLTDECMAEGYEIEVVPAKDPTVARHVYLPDRKPK